MFGTPFQLQAGDVTYGSMPPVNYGPMNPMVASAAMRQSAPEGISKEQLGYLANTLSQVRLMLLSACTVDFTHTSIETLDALNKLLLRFPWQHTMSSCVYIRCIVLVLNY